MNDASSAPPPVGIVNVANVLTVVRIFLVPVFLTIIMVVALIVCSIAEIRIGSA